MRSRGRRSRMRSRDIQRSIIRMRSRRRGHRSCMISRKSMMKQENDQDVEKEQEQD